MEFLSPLPDDYGYLPACLSLERDDAQADDAADHARLVRTLYAAATGLSVYVDADGGEIDVLVVGMKERPPNRYLLSTYPLRLAHPQGP